MLKKLEKYEIEEEIGHGGMATVYRAHDTVLDRPVALKVMHPHLRGAEEARRRLSGPLGSDVVLELGRAPDYRWRVRVRRERLRR